MTAIREEIRDRPVQITLNTITMLFMGAIAFICKQALGDIRANQNVNNTQNLQLAVITEQLRMGTRYTAEDANRDFGNVVLLVNDNGEEIDYNRARIDMNSQELEDIRLHLVVIEGRANKSQQN
jgi:hypothetical protein